MTDVLVLGYGSDLRRDDAAGRRVAEAIARRSFPGVAVMTSTQLLPEHAEAIAAAERVVFVDASVHAQQISVHPLPSPRPAAISHHTTPSELLELVTALGVPSPSALLVEVPAFDVSLGEGLSEPCAAAVEDAIDEVTQLVREPPRSRVVSGTTRDADADGSRRRSARWPCGG